MCYAKAALVLGLVLMPAAAQDDPPQAPAEKKGSWKAETGDAELDKTLEPKKGEKKSDAEVLQGMLKTAAEKKLKGLPEGWDPSKDEFLKALMKEDFFKQGDKTFLAQGGKLLGIRIEHEGKTYVYSPGKQEGFLLDPEGPEKPAQVLKLEGGRVVAKDITRVEPSEDREGVPAPRRDGPSAPAAAPEKVPADGISIANEYKAAPPAKLQRGQCYWDDKTLKLAQEVDADGKVTKSRDVGYMAQLEGVQDGLKQSLVFWHGGAKPYEKGVHQDASSSWALFAVERGQDTASGKFMGFYYNFDLRDPKGEFSTSQTGDGTRLQLWTALKNEPVHKFAAGKVEPLNGGAPSAMLLLQERTPVGRAMVGLDGRQYMDGTVDGKPFVFLGGFTPPAPPPAPPKPPQRPIPAPGEYGTTPLKPGQLDELLRRPSQPPAVKAAYRPGQVKSRVRKSAQAERP